MAKQTLVVEFENKEIRDLIHEKAKEVLGKTPQGACMIEFNQNEGKEVTAKVTFNVKA